MPADKPQPKLGLASTWMLFNEIEARAGMSMRFTREELAEFQRLMTEARTLVSEEDMAYSTVGGWTAPHPSR